MNGLDFSVPLIFPLPLGLTMQLRGLLELVCPSFRGLAPVDGPDLQAAFVGLTKALQG